MTGAAYAYADDNAPVPYELLLLQQIDRFGVESVMGRPVLSAGEIRRMIAAENVIVVYRSSKNAPNIAQWAKDNPEAAELLAKAAKDSECL